MNESNTIKSPPVSVLMNVYNTKEAFLREAIESILNQTFKDFEFIIILDGPTDDSAKVVRSYHDERIIVVENERNIGIPRTLNKGLAIARGKYIAKMDADDISLPRRFEQQFSYMEEHPDIDVLGTTVLNFGEGKTRRFYPSYENDDVAKARMLFFNAGPPHSSSFIRRSFLEKHSLCYDERFHLAEDYKLFYDILWAGGRIHFLRRALVKYRLHANQITKNDEETNKCSKYEKMLIRTQAERLLGPISDRDLAAHQAIHEINMDISIEECDAYITRLFEANQKKKLYEPKSFRKVILSIWLLTEFRMFRRFHSARALKSKYLLPSISPSVVLHTARWKLHG